MVNGNSSNSLSDFYQLKKSCDSDNNNYENFYNNNFTNHNS